MAEPLLSVIVPTHRRPETLAVTLHCLAAATDGSAELIVVDNGGGPETAAVIQAAAATTALRPIRSDQALPMTDSWELGLDHARGAYVTVIGDDDALTADAVGYATYVVGQLKPAILTWEPWLFYWPTCADTRMAGFFGGIVGPDVIRLNLGLALDRDVEDPWVYPAGPGIYQAFVSRAVIEGVRSRFGRYFIDPSPTSARPWSTCWNARPPTLGSSPCAARSRFAACRTAASASRSATATAAPPSGSGSWPRRRRHRGRSSNRRSAPARASRR